MQEPHHLRKSKLLKGEKENRKFRGKIGREKGISFNRTNRPSEQGPRLSIDIQRNEERYEWAVETGGSYLLRTNWRETDPKVLWSTSIQLTEVEDAFRTIKHDLGMRPIFHQKKDRTQAHVLVCFLSLVLGRTLQQWMKASGPGTAPRKLLQEMRGLKSLDVLLPAKDKIIRLRVVATAPQALKVLGQRMKILLPNRPRIIENVVPKNALFFTLTTRIYSFHNL